MCTELQKPKPQRATRPEDGRSPQQPAGKTGTAPKRWDSKRSAEKMGTAPKGWDSKRSAEKMGTAPKGWDSKRSAENALAVSVHGAERRDNSMSFAMLLFFQSM
ncbi:MAG: hypothetical protein CVU57_02735 [Deltaproteobacteria bacterium HGW-Deltaproteobacteria-15]|jgi:hypothetical protein|nr:MAG: hypothetical protein CVU57_02735 [Deltaproteobacteria bacterium HGW-Deltaproteobacteria-15]